MGLVEKVENLSENGRSFGGHFIEDNINAIVDGLIKVENGGSGGGRIDFGEEDGKVHFLGLDLRDEGHSREHVVGNDNKILFVDKVMFCIIFDYDGWPSLTHLFGDLFEFKIDLALFGGYFID